MSNRTCISIQCTCSASRLSHRECSKPALLGLTFALLMITSRCVLQTTTRRLPPAQASAALQQAEQRRKEQGRPSVAQGLCLKDVKALEGKTPLSGMSQPAAVPFHETAHAVQGGWCHACYSGLVMF